MSLREIREEDKEEVAEKLSDYWSGRNMPGHGKDWAADYLEKGHEKDVESDEFFVYEQDGNIQGVISLVTDVRGVAEIRDEAVFSGDDNIFRMMLMELVAEATSKDLRKIYSLATLDKTDIYQELEFDIEGTLKDHYVDGENLVVMSKFL